MSYFKKQNLHASSQEEQKSSNRGGSRHSYLRAFKKYYIDKLIEEKCENKDTLNRVPQDNFNGKSLYEKENRPAERENRVDGENRAVDREKTSTMTDSTSNSRTKMSFGKISQSKIANLVKSNGCELEAVIYGSITEVEKQMARIGDINDLAKQNRLLRQSIGSLRSALKGKLQEALKKNKEEVTAMFEEYSCMIRKLLEDKEALTSALELSRSKCEEQEHRLQAAEESHANQIRIILEKSKAETSGTKRQMEEFLQVIQKYEEEAEREKVELDNLREKLVELEMENDRLKNEQDSLASTRKMTTQYINERCEKQMEKYAEKIEALLQMLEEAQSENQELKQFLKSCKCSRMNSHHTSAGQDAPTVQEVVAKYERQLAQAEKEYVKGEKMLRDALAKKDDCIDRLNLLIEELRVSRYGSVDRMTLDAFQRHLSQQKST